MVRGRGRRRGAAARLAVIAALAIVGATGARAADGVIEINQARAMAGGVTPGDGAGFPVEITQPGSYVLTGGLSPGSGSGRHGILVRNTAGDVTVDLGGFAIAGGGGAGVVVQSGAALSVLVSNGTIREMGGDGVNGPVGIRLEVRGLRILDNGGDGVELGAPGEVSGCEIRGNAAHGVLASSESVIVRENRIASSGGRGVLIGPGSVVVANVIEGNVSDGIAIGDGTSVLENVIRDNGGFAIAPIGSGVASFGLNAISGNSAGDIGLAPSFTMVEIASNMCGMDAVCSRCGDTLCDGAESCRTCVTDCGACCGNGLCDRDLGEDAVSCPADCTAVCGDGVCDPNENCSACSTDCGVCCGNGVCEPVFGEDNATCPADCPVVCGDGRCEGTENPCSCRADCLGICTGCGDGLCEPAREACDCPEDCGPHCGNGTCDCGETSLTCTDCPIILPPP